MADELHLEISGEGDFAMETDCAWEVYISEPFLARVTREGMQIWDEAEGNWRSVWKHFVDHGGPA